VNLSKAIVVTLIDSSQMREQVRQQGADHKLDG
jgi:hypothetical protein